MFRVDRPLQALAQACRRGVAPGHQFDWWIAELLNPLLDRLDGLNILCANFGVGVVQQLAECRVIVPVALLVDFKSRHAAYVLAGYTLLVSSIMHNPVHAAPTEFFLFVKDLGVGGALMALGACSRTRQI